MSGRPCKRCHGFYGEPRDPHDRDGLCVICRKHREVKEAKRAWYNEKENHSENRNGTRQQRPAV
jgi:hypothetical protein